MGTMRGATCMDAHNSTVRLLSGAKVVAKTHAETSARRSQVDLTRTVGGTAFARGTAPRNARRHRVQRWQNAVTTLLSTDSMAPSGASVQRWAMCTTNAMQPT